MVDSLRILGAHRRLLVIYNPTAGGRRRQRFEAVLAELADYGCAMDVRPTGGPGDAVRFAAEADAAAHDLVVAADGDVIDRLPVHIRPLPDALSLVGPPGSAPSTGLIASPS